NQIRLGETSYVFGQNIVCFGSKHRMFRAETSYVSPNQIKFYGNESKSCTNESKFWMNKRAFFGVGTKFCTDII
ncbi:MAG: hypothetical protein LBL74_02360, partial [Bacteroidales bacterium]|nr:hypothetical protein [Bacteroidales bacterium]